jgi:hypothetical protein
MQRPVPPKGNRLEKLAGDLKGFWSIRVNDQYRVVFKWADGTADEVRIVDYHQGDSSMRIKANPLPTNRRPTHPGEILLEESSRRSDSRRSRWPRSSASPSSA